MDFSRMVRALEAVRGRDAWVAVTTAADDDPQAAVLHGSLGELDEGFLPLEVSNESDLNGNIGVAFDPDRFEGAEGSLPGDLLVRLRDANVRVATR